MKKYKLEKDFIIEGYRCVIIGQRMGHRCGYIEIPTDHDLYAKNYYDIPIEVHGGWTYSEYTYNNYPAESSDKSWWIGFDCGHFDDAKDLELIKSFGDDETTRLYVELESKFAECGEIRTTEYVENELRRAVEQLKDINKRKIEINSEF